MILLQSDNVDAIHYLIHKNMSLVLSASDHMITMVDAKLTEEFTHFCELNDVKIQMDYEY
jgi:hypothetical protein